jgi:hypothetical protein
VVIVLLIHDEARKPVSLDVPWVRLSYKRGGAVDFSQTSPLDVLFMARGPPWLSQEGRVDRGRPERGERKSSRMWGER